MSEGNRSNPGVARRAKSICGEVAPVTSDASRRLVTLIIFSTIQRASNLILIQDSQQTGIKTFLVVRIDMLISKSEYHIF